MGDKDAELVEGMKKVRRKHDPNERKETFAGEFATRIAREEKRLVRILRGYKRDHGLDGFKHLIALSSEYKVKVRESQMDIMKNIKRVQRGAWAVRDMNSKREHAKYLLKELDFDPDDPDNDEGEKYDGT